MISKKSQLYSQIFIYILTLVLISLILVYGYKYINDFKKRAEKLSCLKFEKDMQNSIQLLLSDFGSVKRKELKLCSGYKQICFVETFRQFNRNFPTSNVDPIDPLILDSVQSGTEKNVFLVGNTAKESFYAGKISLEPAGLDVLCINSTKSLRLESKGSYVMLSEWK